MTDDPVRRRALLGALAAAGTASLAGCPSPGGGGEPSPTDDEADATVTRTASPEPARRLAERFAPTLYFDAAERWFPTDPRPYASDRDGETVVGGFDALDGYTRRTREGDGPADPTVFYHVVEYADSPLAVVQYWCYSAFDQFSANFHWHDWEVLHVFVDTDSGDPQLLVASAHSRRVPNNEFLDPDPEVSPRVLTELGSHSSTLSLNDRPESFQRLALEDLVADITNRALDGVEALADLPIAYGLPRDEGMRLPYLVPELDGAPVYEHERLPAVDRETLVPEALTVRSFDALSEPPTDLPGRETGHRFVPAGRVEGAADVPYDLVPASEVTHIDGFDGPQLSFEFAVPTFAEDAVASHITSAGVPWEQERWTDPAADVTDPVHRAALAERYDGVTPPGPVSELVAVVSEVVQSPDAPAGAGVQTTDLGVEAVALLRSDPVAAPTFRGVAVLRDVEPGEHRLTVNGPGLAPHGEPVSVATPDDAATDGGSEGDRRTVLAGVEGEVPLVAAENARKLEVDADGAEADLTAFAVDDDFGGRLYEAPVEGPDAVYVHRDGAYTAEVRDVDGAVGAVRVDPTDDASLRIDRPRTGKASLASFVSTITAETAERLAAVRDGDGATDVTDGEEGDPATTEQSTVTETEERDPTATAVPTATETGERDATATDDPTVTAVEGSDETDATATDGVELDLTVDGVTDDGVGGALGGLLRAMSAVGEAADRAAGRAERGDRTGTDRALRALAAALERAIERFESVRDDLPGPEAAAAERRLEQARRRTEQAIASEKL